MLNPRSSVLVYLQIHNGRVEIWLVLTAEVYFLRSIVNVLLMAGHKKMHALSFVN
jgi:hypothetical protein